MNKNVLIIGGSYFVGRVFVEQLIASGDFSIYVVNRGNRPLMESGVNEIVCDRNDSEGLKTLIPSLTWDAVVDFCAYAPEELDSTMKGLRLDFCKHYILISTASIYEKTHAFPIKEDAPKLTGPQDELGPYGRYGYDKWMTEQKLAELAEPAGMPYTCLRPSIIYGKYNYAPRESYFFELIRRCKTVVLPDNDLALFQFVSVWDVARIICRCIGNPKTFGSAYNLAGEELVCYRGLVEVLEKVSGRRIVTTTASIETINQMRIPLPFALDSHWIYSGRLIEQALEFQYTPFLIGMQHTYDWYITQVR